MMGLQIPTGDRMVCYNVTDNPANASCGLLGIKVRSIVFCPL